MTLYMAVTADEYELPIAVEEKSSNLARRIGIHPETVYKELCYSRKGIERCNGKRRGYALREVEVSDDE